MGERVQISEFLNAIRPKHALCFTCYCKYLNKFHHKNYFDWYETVPHLKSMSEITPWFVQINPDIGAILDIWVVSHFTAISQKLE